MNEKDIEKKLIQVWQESEDWIHQQEAQQLRDIVEQTEDGDISVR